MDTFTAIEQRRAVKKFDPNHRLTEQEITRLMQAAVLSPTSFNIQNWRFVLITDPEMKRKIREVGFDQAQFSDASLIVFVCGDRKAYARDPERYWRDAPTEARQEILAMLHGAYDGKPQRQHDEVIRSGSLAAMTIMLAAKAMGYDTCPMLGFVAEAVAELIHLPPEHEIVMAVTVGRRLEDPRPRSGQLPLDEVVFRERFPA